jgi:UDP-N-acetylglucosamine 2-epimerase (non-hydrolysing)
MIKISFILGTRPEAIKLAPLILMLKERSEFEVNVCATGQHKEMLYQALDLFDIKVDEDLQLMKPNQDIMALNANALIHISDYLKRVNPDIVIVQGDTTTVFAAALASFYNKIPVAHIEAGLRTFDKYSPFPEEMNRVLTSRLTTLHFAPTELAKQNLLKEGINSSDVFVTGNTVIDALFLIKDKIQSGLISEPHWVKNLLSNQVILITGHRRENFGSGIKSICNAIVELSKKYPDFVFIYPVHLNPNIQEPVKSMLSAQKNISLIEPLDYVSFVALMNKCYLILTDSGGIQEEAPSLGKPVLVMRENSERPEAITAGTARLVGTDKQTIVEEVSKLIEDEFEYNSMAKSINPYGDGNACERIISVLKQKLPRHATVDNR